MSELTPSQCRTVGMSWRWRMEQEHLAVSVFSQLAGALATLGCQPVILSMITRAAADEVRHSEACAGLARRWLGDDAVPAFFRGAATLPAWGEVTPAQTLALHVAETCCISETLTAGFFTEMAERTTDTFTREIVRELLAEELDHARVGWAYLRELERRGFDLAFLGRLLPIAIERQVGDILAGNGAKDDPALEAYGYLGQRAAAEIYRAGLVDVVYPGFAELGVELLASAPSSEPSTRRGADGRHQG